MSEDDGLFNKLKNLWKSFKDDYQTPYRLIEIEHKKREKFAVIGLRYSHMVFKKKLQEAVLDDELLEGLSPQDIRSLSMYAMFCCTQDQYELVSIDYVDSEKVVFAIKDKLADRVLKLTQEELNNSPNIINHFKRNELYKVGVVCGSKLNN
ncbi:hypothetical protein JQC92_16815 [Shewanella sp. 202IG2-18]|uniref:hypothetical protein n=2 Tax=Parashewanella hymeniacidonis TaxID=2807618 RepID=UPI00195FCAD6|nr:hypothetical protein [Parashewanella hymeniacidonis]MBM7073673.1 hypothetical protein [Parashewanella hymeniacidonis]